MSALTNDLKKLTETAEKTAVKEGGFRQKLHLMPPVGWLNDPNGLCQFGGVFHAFFQYSPFDPEGGVKMWGHYTSRNMIDWEYKGVMLYPDQPLDCSGVYSGCAYIEDGEMYLYYTGNVKLEDGEGYDYINTADLDTIKAAGYPATTMFILTNADQFGRVEKAEPGEISAGSRIMEIEK